MRRIITAALAAFAVLTSTLALAPAAQAGESVTGKGSSFANNFMQACIVKYNAANTGGHTVTYTSTGSGTGKSQFASDAVDFAASDSAYSSGYPTRGYAYVPVTGGPVAIAYNKVGVKNLKLTPAILSGIFSGSITTWNDPAIVKINKSQAAKLTGAITVVYRSGTSGTTQNLQNYLYQTVGGSWPAANQSWAGGSGTGAGTSAIMVTTIANTAGSIGYADVSVVASAGVRVKYALLKNAKGQFVKPTAKAASKFLAAQADPKTNGIVNINFKKKVKGAYQLSILTYLIVPTGRGTAEAAVVRDFSIYAVKVCGKTPAKGYVSLKSGTKKAIWARAIAQSKKAG